MTPSVARRWVEKRFGVLAMVAVGAFTAPAALSILTTSFEEGPRRNRSLGVYTAAAACGFTFGLVSGGLLTQEWPSPSPPED